MRVTSLWSQGGSSPLFSKDAARLIMLPMSGEANYMGVILVDEDRGKQKYLTLTMTALRTFCKSVYATWLHFFDEGNGSRNGASLPDVLALNL